MGIVFQQGSVLYIATDTHKYKLLVGEVSASQTFIGNTQRVKTIQNTELLDRTFVTEKGKASLNFTTFIGRQSPDTQILEWFDMTKLSTTKYGISSDVKIPSKRDIYIKHDSTVYKLPNSCGTNLSFVISHTEVLAVKVSCSSPDLIDISQNGSEMATFNSLIENSQDTEDFITNSVAVQGYNNLLGLSVELTREVTWLNQKSVFDLDTMYKVTNPIITSMAISGAITQTKLNNNNNLYTPSSNVQISYGNTFKLHLNGCSLTERFDLGNFHRVVTDYALLPTSDNSYIQF